MLPNAGVNALDTAFGVLAFGLQILFDFSAYSDIAIGTARLFGLTFPENFDWPYFSRSPQEFWNRWHMTLSLWIRDYVFTPLSFAARAHPKTTLLWLWLAMAICGFWHGAQWVFIVWGLWHGFLLILNQTVLRKFFPAIGEAPGRRSFLRNQLCTARHFWIGQHGWIFFRAPSLAAAWNMIGSLATIRGWLRPAALRESAVLIIFTIFLVFIMARSIWSFFDLRDGVSLRFPRFFRVLKPVAYAFLVMAAVVFHQNAKAFVYFQF